MNQREQHFVAHPARAAAGRSFTHVIRIVNWARWPKNRYKRFDLECTHQAVE
jgi:hypothetical protein